MWRGGFFWRRAIASFVPLEFWRVGGWRRCRTRRSAKRANQRAGRLAGASRTSQAVAFAALTFGEVAAESPVATIANQFPRHVSERGRRHPPRRAAGKLGLPTGASQSRALSLSSAGRPAIPHQRKGENRGRESGSRFPRPPPIRRWSIRRTSPNIGFSPRRILPAPRLALPSAKLSRIHGASMRKGAPPIPAHSSARLSRCRLAFARPRRPSSAVRPAQWRRQKAGGLRRRGSRRREKRRRPRRVRRCRLRRRRKQTRCGGEGERAPQRGRRPERQVFRPVRGQARMGEWRAGRKCRGEWGKSLCRHAGLPLEGKIIHHQRSGGKLRPPILPLPAAGLFAAAGRCLLFLCCYIPICLCGEKTTRPIRGMPRRALHIPPPSGAPPCARLPLRPAASIPPDVPKPVEGAFFAPCRHHRPSAFQQENPPEPVRADGRHPDCFACSAQKRAQDARHSRARLSPPPCPSPPHCAPHARSHKAKSAPDGREHHRHSSGGLSSTISTRQPLSSAPPFWTIWDDIPFWRRQEKRTPRSRLPAGGFLTPLRTAASPQSDWTAK